MSGIVRTIFGGTSPAERRQAALAEQQAKENQKVQQINQAQTLQAQGQQTADLNKDLASVRKAGRGRRLLLNDAGGKTTVG